MLIRSQSGSPLLACYTRGSQLVNATRAIRRGLGCMDSPTIGLKQERRTWDGFGDGDDEMPDRNTTLAVTFRMR
jgi:hypothetical protein